MQTFKSFEFLPSATVQVQPQAPVSRSTLKQYEPQQSPKSMTQRIWDVTVKTGTSSKWDHRSHPRTPKNRETSPRIRFIKGKFYIGQMDEPLDTLDAAKSRLKELGYLRYYWFGALKMVG